MKELKVEDLYAVITAQNIYSYGEDVNKRPRSKERILERCRNQDRNLLYILAHWDRVPKTEKERAN